MSRRQRLQQQRQTHKQRRRAWNKKMSVDTNDMKNNMIVYTGGPQIDA